MASRSSENQKACGGVCVLGIGNVLLMDEGAGPAVVQALLDGYEFPEGVDVREGATMGLALLPELRDHAHMIVVDAVDGTGLAPGTVVRFSPDDVARSTPGSLSAHDMRFSDVLDAARLLGYECSGHCVGIQVGEMAPEEFTIGLTPDVEAAVPLAVQTVLALLHELGAGPVVDKRTGEAVA